MGKRTIDFYNDFIGKKFNNLTILEILRIKGKTYAYCVCKCGKNKKIQIHNIIQEKVKGCGCLRKGRFIHGDSPSDGCNKLYRIWVGIKVRCDNPKHNKYKWYGEKGISYDPKWKQYIEFKKDMYLKWIKYSKLYGEEKISIERIDPNKDYVKENCTFTTMFKQHGNTSKNKLFIAKNLITGKIYREKNIREFSRKHKLPHRVITRVLSRITKKSKLDSNWYFSYI